MDLKTLIYSATEARPEIYRGAELAARAVTSTLGPKGKIVLIAKPGQPLNPTKDGVTVSKSINLKAPLQRLGANLVKEAAARTNETAGDGTTTATALTIGLLRRLKELLDKPKVDVPEVCVGINAAVDDVTRMIKDIAVQLDDQNKVVDVATISANGDRTIGELIAQAIARVTLDGVVTVEDAKGTQTSLEVIEGMRFDRGYLSPYFVNNNDKMHVFYEQVAVLVTDKKVTTFKDLVPVLEQTIARAQPLLIIADDIADEALQTLVVNRVKATAPVVAIRAPGYGDNRVEILKDICTLVGAKLISSSTGRTLEKFESGWLGKVKRCVVDSKSTTLVGTGLTATTVAERIEEIRSQMSDVTLSTEQHEVLRHRLARLAAGVAIIRVGGVTELEMVERRYRIEDALHATLAAAQEGIVPGGGSALAWISSVLWKNLANKNFASNDVAHGYSIVLQTCDDPMNTIAANAGFEPDEFRQLYNQFVNDENSTQHNRPRLGYDANTGEFKEMISAGIVDPAKVTRCALQNACSVAITFANLGAVIVEEETNAKEHVTDAE